MARFGPARAPLRPAPRSLPEFRPIRPEIALKLPQSRHFSLPSPRTEGYLQSAYWGAMT